MVQGFSPVAVSEAVAQAETAYRLFKRQYPNFISPSRVYARMTQQETRFRPDRYQSLLKKNDARLAQLEQEKRVAPSYLNLEDRCRWTYTHSNALNCGELVVLGQPFVAATGLRPLPFKIKWPADRRPFPFSDHAFMVGNNPYFNPYQKVTHTGQEVLIDFQNGIFSPLKPGLASMRQLFGLDETMKPIIWEPLRIDR
jgi:hypothetical protein